MTDVGVWALAGAVVLGALVPVDVPVVLGLVPVGLALVARRPVLLVLAAPLLASALSAGAHQGARPADPAAFDGVVVLTTDPDDAFGAARAQVKADGARYELWARGAAARPVRGALAGERVVVRGRIEPRAVGAEHLRVRHVVGRLVADSVVAHDAGGPLARSANGLRRVLDRGTEPLSPSTRSLFLGFVLGDDRGQDPAVIDDFRATGLTHLLAVSGANVAFVLVVLGPLLRRLELTPRFVVVLAALVGFAVLTRFEPSVLRATAMAAVASSAVTIGRNVSSSRALALTVAGLVLADPFLVSSLGFRLSVAASLGIIVWAQPIAARLRGPRPLAEAMAVTIAAQVFVAPLLVGTGDGVPVLALPANVLAAPAAGPVMVWGLTGGLAAGVLGSPVADLIHLPTAVLLGWVQGVSRWLAAVPAGRIAWPHVIALAGLALWAAGRRRRSATAWLRTPVAAAVVVVSVAALTPAPARAGVMGAGPGASLWSAGGSSVLVVDGRAQPDAVLAQLRRAGHRRVDLAVGRSPSRATKDVLDTVIDRLAPGAVLVPEPLGGGPRTVVDRPTTVIVGGVQVDVRPDGDRLAVEVSFVPGEGGGPPEDAGAPEPGGLPEHAGRPEDAARETAQYRRGCPEVRCTVTPWSRPTRLPP